MSYEGWHGTVETFELTSEKYAIQFMLSNRSKLVNLSAEAIRALAAAETALVTQATAAHTTARSIQPQSQFDKDGGVLLKWIEKVEGAKGPAARRATIELALSDEGLAIRRDDFIRAAAQIELRATFDKVESLKTPAAKKRHLADALDALRSDSASDTLQAAEIERLEKALREIDS